MPAVTGRRGPASPARAARDAAGAALWPRCLGNAAGKADRRGNLYPAKRRLERKTDAAVALLMAVGRAMAENEGGTVDLEVLLPPSGLRSTGQPVEAAGAAVAPTAPESGSPSAVAARTRAGVSAAW